MKTPIMAILLIGLLSVISRPATVHAGQISESYPTAILPFKVHGQRLSGYGQKVSNVLFATLAANPAIELVDREEIDKLIDEAELNLSGMVSSRQAIQIGHLTGARVLVTGSLFELDDNLIIVAKIVGTETSRVFGERVQGKVSDDLMRLVEALSEKVAADIVNNADKLVVKGVSRKDRLAALRNRFGTKDRASVAIDITERHIGRASIDPAAETEMAIFFKDVGYKVLDTGTASARNADILIKGEGFSEFAMRHGNIISVKARLEVKAIDRKTAEVLAVDRQMEVEVDVTEQIAAKKALQNAAAAIAERMIQELVRLE